MDENIIVYLGNGCGKTHISVMVIYELGHLVLSPTKSVCIFLAPTVALVEQQAKVIAESINFKVAEHCGGKRIVKTHSEWEREISENEVLVMTPQILLHNLQHCFIRMECISLLISMSVTMLNNKATILIQIQFYRRSVVEFLGNMQLLQNFLSSSLKKIA